MLQLSDNFGDAQVTDDYLLAVLSGQRVTASLVVDEDGSTQDVNGGSKLLGGDTDLQWLRALRSRSDLVVTGGVTYRAEQYRMPRNADLAVFSRSPLTAPQGYQDSPRFLPFVGARESISAELTKLRGKYRTIHLEFGAQTLFPVTRELGLGIWLSSQYKSGIDYFCEESQLRQLHALRVNDLHIAYCL